MSNVALTPAQRTAKELLDAVGLGKRGTTETGGVKITLREARDLGLKKWKDGMAIAMLRLHEIYGK